MLAETRSINTMLLDEEEFRHIENFKECIFCKPPDKKILTETDNFFITYDACALLDGHLEIHTKDHIGCAAEIDPQMFDEFVELKSWMGSLIKSIYGQVSFYEHGRAGHCGMTVDGVICHHFHLHALPLKTDVSETVSKLAKPIMIESERRIPELYEQFDQYLYFENNNEEKFFFPISKPIPNHYLRTVIAEAIGHPERADWENYCSRDAINNFKLALQKHEAEHAE
jgi:diadenosine tetraphosphate (Ap4A) HIT family hydrolase